MEEKLGRFITRYANTQNEVSSQDFAFLDKEQHRLVRELSVLDFEYILRSAEVPKSKDPKKIIELREAAVALACASSSVNLAVVAKREVSLLFSNASFYKTLFNEQTDPLRLSRAVEITAAVDYCLDAVERQTDGIQAGIAVHGRRVIAHVLMRKLGDKFLREPKSDFEAALSNLDDEVLNCLVAFVKVFPENSYPGNVFKNQSRVNYLIRTSGVL
ncbi:AIPR family protein [Micromonospora sp. WMMD980]|uniref:AIPR family protein n=1 Tax=Micromonospora sp. WMMD980 TaxID=3016088 RepID=UPI0024164D44|nr:AIPR family protein [Micromonospora sp. WMMD980]MDG4801332.1 AIPR family protein [Micromonospora sp. WMMD980]